MKVRLEVYLPWRGRQVWKGEEEVPDGTTPVGLLRHLGLDGQAELALLVNGRHFPPDQSLPAGAEVAILRRSEGGC